MSSHQSSSDYEPERKKSLLEIVPLEKKIEIVNLRRAHLTWSYSIMKVHGGRFVPRLDELTRWKKEIINGGTKYDKSEAIKKWTYKRFQDARERKQHITTEGLRTWALQGVMQYESGNFTFETSPAWIKRFKKEFRIVQRRVTKYIKQTNRRSEEQIKILTSTFQEEIREITASVNLDFVINTDQMRCEYRAYVVP